MKYSSFIIFISYIASPKFCLHCTHFIPNKLGNDFSRCKFFPVTDTSFLVTEMKYNYCSTARNLDYMCGKYAKRYFPKDTEPTGGKGSGGGGDDFSGIISKIQIEHL